MKEKLIKFYFIIFPEIIMHNHTWAVRRFVRSIRSTLRAKSRVLDAGAGNLQYKKFFSGHEYIGLDYAPNTGLDVVASVTELPFHDEVFDAVVSIQVLEHLHTPSEFFKEACRCLKPGGRLFLSTHNAFPLHMEPHDYYRFTSYGLRYLAESNGLQVESITPQGGVFLVLSKLLQLAIPEILKDKKLILVYYLLFTIPIFLVNLLCFALDKLDTSKRITLNYECIFRK